MTSSPPSPTEVAGLERREAGRGPAGSVSQGEAGADGAGSVPDLRRPSPFPACSRLLCRHALAAAAPSQFISFEWARESAFPQGLGLSVGLAFGRRRVSLGVCCFSQAVPGTCVGCKGGTPSRSPTSLTPPRQRSHFSHFSIPSPHTLPCLCTFALRTCHKPSAIRRGQGGLVRIVPGQERLGQDWASGTFSSFFPFIPIIQVCTLKDFFWHLSPKTSRDYSADVNLQVRISLCPWASQKFRCPYPKILNLRTKIYMR